MKANILTLLFVIGSTILLQAQNARSTNKTLRHIVFVKFKDTSSEQEVKQVTTAFTELKSSIKQIKGFEWGLNNSPENLNEGLTHAFTLSFSSEKDRDDYLVHPEHKKFVDTVGPHIEKVVVMDYWAEEVSGRKK